MKAERNKSNRPARLMLLGLAAAMPFVGGCNIRQILGFDMYNQPKYGKPYKSSDFFQDGSSARPIVENTVPRGEVYVDRSSVGVVPVLYAGQGFPPDFPEKDTKLEGEALRKVLVRGQEKFNVYCAVCHGQTGLADGMIVQRGFIKPPAFVLPDEAVQEEMKKAEPYRWERTQFMQSAPPRHVYNVISNGYGAMYSYGERVAPADRWAIAAYIKAMQAAPRTDAQLLPQPTYTDKAAAK